jgi:hypothetical protein
MGMAPDGSRMKDHYVMKSHLDKFIHPTSKERVLYPYRKGMGQLHPKGPRHLGCAEGFYNQVLEDGAESTRLDEGFQLGEKLLFSSGKRTPSTLSRCVYDEAFFPTTDQERAEITFCTSFMYCRAPVQIHNTAMIRHLGANIDVFNRLDAEDEELVKSYMEANDVTKDEAQKQVAKSKDEILRGNMTVSVGWEHERQDGFNMLTLQQHIMSVVDDMRWRLLRAASGSSFLTTDNPVVVEDPSFPKKRMHGMRQSRRIEVWFPISHEIGLLVDWRREQPQGRVVASHSQTRALNRRMIKWCYRHVYSPRREDWIAEATKSAKFRPLLDRLTSIDEWCKSARGNIVDMMSALENGEEADVFADLQMC